jgi:hypothetical protein
MARPSKAHKRFSWRKDWPWVAIAAIAVGVFFIHPATAPKPKTAKKGKHARGVHARGREHYANLGNDGGPVS